MHIAVIGTGRVGRTVAFALCHEEYITELSLVDIIPELAEIIAEEIRHSTASTLNPITFHAYKDSREISGADIVIITAGFPRTPEMKSRRELIAKNAEVIRTIVEEVVPGNKGVRYIVVTNPVDALATLFAELSGEKFVISTGTSLDSLRFRSELSKHLGVPINQIEGYVGGEHGEAAVFLWSTVRVRGKPLAEYEIESGVELNNVQVEKSVKRVSRDIIRVLGGTMLGPACAFRDIIRSVALDKREILPVAAPYYTEGVSQPVHVSIPRKVGWSLGATLEDSLTSEEVEGLRNAARAIQGTYEEALKSLKE